MTPAEFESQYEPYHEELRCYLIKRMQSEDDADEVLQLTVCAALRGLHTFSSGTNLRAWLYQIARNESVDFWKRRKRLSSLVEAASTESRTFETCAAPPEPFEEMAPQLTYAMDQLPPQHRRALELFVVEGLSYEEIAKMEGCPVMTVGSRIIRAKEQLRSHLQGFDYKERIKG